MLHNFVEFGCTRVLKNTVLNIHEHLLSFALVKTGVTLGRIETQMKIMMQQALEYMFENGIHTVGS